MTHAATLRLAGFGLGAMLCAGAPPAAAFVYAPGVSENQVVVATHADLSGPLAPVGHSVVNGLTMAFDEANKAGGVRGRTLKLIVKDNGYDAQKAVAVLAPILKQREAFAVLCPVGTPPVAATMRMVLKRGVLHLFPFSSSAETYVPSQLLEFASDLPVADQISIALAALLNQRGALHVGVLYRDDSLGRAARLGAMKELARRGLPLTADVAYKPGTTNFSKQIATLREKGVELAVLGSVATDVFTIARQARAARFGPVMLCPATCHVPEMPALGGRSVDKLYATAMTPIAYVSKDANTRNWARTYERRFGGPASVQAFRAYLDARLFVEALKRSGSRPTPLRFARVLEKMPPWVDPVYGGVPMNFSKRNHTGLTTVFLAQIRNGRWTAQSGPLNRPAQ